MDIACILSRKEAFMPRHPNVKIKENAQKMQKQKQKKRSKDGTTWTAKHLPPWGAAEGGALSICKYLVDLRRIFLNFFPWA